MTRFKVNSEKKKAIVDKKSEHGILDALEEILTPISHFCLPIALRNILVKTFT